MGLEESGAIVEEPHGRIVETYDERELDMICNPDVQAVILRQYDVPWWLAEIERLVSQERLVGLRGILGGINPDELGSWLLRVAPCRTLAVDIRNELAADIVNLARRAARLMASNSLRVRFITSATCGFHVDTVLPGASPWALVRVYGGAGTMYVPSGGVCDMNQFYSYLKARERLINDIAMTERSGWPAGDLSRQLVELDSTPPFIKEGVKILSVPRGSVVAFRQLDVGYLFADHPQRMAWIHSAPISRSPRLVVNITSGS